MSLDAVSDDLPPRTWRIWWRERPGWLRIGCWAALAMIGLHVALAVRIYVGLFDTVEIKALRRPGVHIIFVSDQRGEPFNGFNRLLDGVKGRSNADVLVIRLDEQGTDADLKLIGKHFPNLAGLHLINAAISADGLASLASCRNLRALDLTATDLDDVQLKELEKLESLSSLEISETLITDEALATLKRLPKLWHLNVSYTDVSLAAVQEWRKQQAPGKGWIGTEKDQVTDAVLGLIRWADGTRSGRFAGRYETKSLGPIIHGTSQRTSSMMSSHLRRHHLWWDQQWFMGRGDGEYRITLKLGDYESAPATVIIENGKPSTHRIEFQMPVTKAQALK